MRLALMVPCHVDQCFPRVGQAAMMVLERLGHEVLCPPNFLCCGQPASNAGDNPCARKIAAPVLDMFDGVDAVVVPSASCAAMVIETYPTLFAESGVNDAAAKTKADALASKTHEFCQFLVDVLGVTDLGATLDAKVTFHDGCHGLRALELKQAPRQLLEKVSGLSLVEMQEAETCCGFGGLFCVKFPDVSAAMAEVKTQSAMACQPDALVSADPSCLMHLKSYMAKQSDQPLPCWHVAEVLAGMV